MKLVANQYCASIAPRTVKTKPKKRLTASQLTCNGDDNNCLLTKTASPLFGKRLWEMRHERAVYISVLHHSSWKVYLPLDFVNYLITQPIWLGVSWAQYEKFAPKVSIKDRIYDIMDTDHDCSYKWVRNWKHQNPNSTNPRSTKMIYVITWKRIAGKLTDIEFWICPTMLHGTPTYTFHKSKARQMKRTRSKYVPIPGSSWQFSWNKYDLLTTIFRWILVIAMVNF